MGILERMDRDIVACAVDIGHPIGFIVGPSWKFVISPEPETPYADFVKGTQ